VDLQTEPYLVLELSLSGYTSPFAQVPSSVSRSKQAYLWMEPAREYQNFSVRVLRCSDNVASTALVTMYRAFAGFTRDRIRLSVQE
jgi:hypothetical protein